MDIILAYLLDYRDSRKQQKRVYSCFPSFLLQLRDKQR